MIFRWNFRMTYKKIEGISRGFMKGVSEWVRDRIFNEFIEGKSEEIVVVVSK